MDKERFLEHVAIYDFLMNFVKTSDGKWRSGQTGVAHRPEQLFDVWTQWAGLEKLSEAQCAPIALPTLPEGRMSHE